METSVIKYTISQASRLDRECQELAKVYIASRIKIGLELAKRLKEIDDNKLYKKLDEDSYPNFATYLASLDMKYSTAREAIGIYETYVLSAGKSIDELAEISYHKLTALKSKFFKREAGQYKFISTKTELNKWLSDAKSDLTREDLVQKRKEEEVGKHEHEWEYITIRKCTKCDLRERHYEK